MSKPQPGFVMPSNGPPPQYPGYPSQPNAYPNSQQPYPGQPMGYPQAYPGQPQAYPNHHQPYPGNQPFPPPIQPQPSFNSHPIIDWYNRNFQTYLTNATSFHVKQKVELIEALIGWETGNKYSVMDNGGHKIFYVGEESNMCGRQLCGSRRPFTLTVKDTSGQNVLVMDRELDCSCCFSLACPDTVTISTPGGQLLGSIKEEFSILFPTFKVKDAAGKTVLRVQGPACPVSFGKCAGPVVFRILNSSGASVGTISKEWGGLVREFLTDADSFSISFPQDLDPSIKAVLLGALFLIDFEYFERND